MKIRSVTRVTLEEAVPVYDVTVSGTENFKLYKGPIVHNSKDVSDAVAGVVVGLSMRREIWGMCGVQPSVLFSAQVNEKVKPASDQAQG